MDTIMKVSSTIFNPFAGLARKINKAFTIASYSRAASELARQGLYKESKALMMQLKDFKNEV